MDDVVTPRKDRDCFACGKGYAEHWLEEWDAYIHAGCVPKFLQTEEGAILIAHGHTILVDFDLTKGFKAPK